MDKEDNEEISQEKIEAVLKIAKELGLDEKNNKRIRIAKTVYMILTNAEIIETLCNMTTGSMNGVIDILLDEYTAMANYIFDDSNSK